MGGGELKTTLFDWTWVLGGKSYRIFGPGYYFDTFGGKLYFTVKWHDANLCDQLIDISEEHASELAMPPRPSPRDPSTRDAIR